MGRTGTISQRSCVCGRRRGGLAGRQGWGDPLSEGAYERPAWPPGPESLTEWRAVLEREPALEPALRGVVDGMASGVDRLRACGNGVVPVVAAVAFTALWRRLNEPA